MSSSSISIEHCTDRDFLEAFRKDLANTINKAIVLSPFISKKRAACYYYDLHLLAQKNIKTDIYTKPMIEQPKSLQNHFKEVESSLKLIGVGFYVRPGMHEKIGILDDKIIWHGSLNILSHNNTKESMLRIESPELVQEVRAELLGEIYATPSKSSADAPEAYTPGCPTCKSPMLWFDDAKLWICTNSPTCSGTLTAQTHADTEARRQPQSTGLQCPLCQGEMVIHRGVFTRVACSNATCGYSMDPRLSAGLVRLWRRRGQL